MRTTVALCILVAGLAFVRPNAVLGGQQIPGDCNQDEELDLADAVCLLWFLFLGGPSELPCGDRTAADPANVRLLDWNDDGSVDPSDVVRTLTFLFLSGQGHPLGRGCVEIAGCPQTCEGSGCPIPVARARIQTRGDLWESELRALPLQTLEFDGLDSFDPEGSPIAAYEWDVSTRPPGSVSTFRPNPQIASPTFFLDLAGRYVFTLRVFDQEGLESCDTATITVTATPTSADMYIQLVWDTPGDPDRTDMGAGRGSDVDLHVMHPNGQWNEPPWDCFWENPAPNWGDTGSSEDDPSLEIDDHDGWGPEGVRLSHPEGTIDLPVSYLVGAFCFSDHGFGPSVVTIRIFLDGEESFTATSPPLESGQFWDAARVTWATRRVERVDALHANGFPDP